MIKALGIAMLCALVGCADSDKIEKLEKALQSQEELLRALQKEQVLSREAKDLLLSKGEEAALVRLKKERDDLKQSLQARNGDLSETAKLQNEIAELKNQLAVTGGGARVVERYENGKKKYEGDREDGGTRTGSWTFWHPNGQKWSEGTYKSGKLEGVWTYWRDNGKKRWDGSFKDDKRDGVWTWWDEQGNAWMTETYKYGELVK